MKRPVVLALAAQVAIVGAIAAPRLLVRLTGTEYRLRVQPVDPIDPFRGAYVALRYEGFATEHDGRLYVTLRRDGDAWVGDRVVDERPEGVPYVACVADDGSLDCGIESWFASQRAAKEAEQRLANGAIAKVRVGGSGRAVLVGLE